MRSKYAQKKKERRVFVPTYQGWCDNCYRSKGMHTEGCMRDGGDNYVGVEAPRSHRRQRPIRDKRPRYYDEF